MSIFGGGSIRSDENPSTLALNSYSWFYLECSVPDMQRQNSVRIHDIVSCRLVFASAVYIARRHWSLVLAQDLGALMLVWNRVAMTVKLPAICVLQLRTILRLWGYRRSLHKMAGWYSGKPTDFCDLRLALDAIPDADTSAILDRDNWKYIPLHDTWMAM